MDFRPLHAICFFGGLFCLHKEATPFPSASEDEPLVAPLHLSRGTPRSHTSAGTFPVVISPVRPVSRARTPPFVLLWEVVVLYLQSGVVPFVGACLCRELAWLAGILSVDALDLGSREAEACMDCIAARNHTLRAYTLGLWT